MTERTMEERMAAVETWQEGHETRCDDRQSALGREIGELKRGLGGLRNSAWAVALALLGFMALQLYGKLDQARPTFVAPAALAPR